LRMVVLRTLSPSDIKLKACHMSSDSSGIRVTFLWKFCKGKWWWLLKCHNGPLTPACPCLRICPAASSRRVAGQDLVFVSLAGTSSIPSALIPLAACHLHPDFRDSLGSQRRRCIVVIGSTQLLNSHGWSDR